MDNRFLITHSLLSSWLYAMKENPYEDATSDRDAFAEFMTTLRRESTPTTPEMQKGIDFENFVTDIINGDTDAMGRYENWFDAAYEIAQIIRGGALQYKAQKEIAVDGMTFLLYGHLDALKAGVIYDIKFSGGYERGKYFESTQHPTYLELIPQAREFTYLVSNGSAVWRETYRRDETGDIKEVISDFVSWLYANDLMDTYKEHWLAK